MRGPLIVAEIAVRCASGDDQMVIRHALPVLKHHGALRNVNVDHITEQRRHIALPAEQEARWRRNRRRGKPRRRHLIQQRLKQMMIGAVDQSDLNSCGTQRLRGFQSTETTADDDDFRAGGCGVRHR